MMSKNEDLHLEAFVNFILNDKVLLEAIQSSDWTKFAEKYNGPDYAENKYDIKMRNAYKDYLSQEITDRRKKQEEEERKFWEFENRRMKRKLEY